jgi:hypothetical protein
LLTALELAMAPSTPTAAVQTATAASPVGVIGWRRGRRIVNAARKAATIAAM